MPANTFILPYEGEIVKILPESSRFYEREMSGKP